MMTYFTLIIGPFLLNGIMFTFSNNGSHVIQHSQNEHSGLNGRREDDESCRHKTNRSNPSAISPELRLSGVTALHPPAKVLKSSQALPPAKVMMSTSEGFEEDCCDSAGTWFHHKSLAFLRLLAPPIRRHRLVICGDLWLDQSRAAAGYQPLWISYIPAF